MLYVVYLVSKHTVDKYKFFFFSHDRDKLGNERNWIKTQNKSTYRSVPLIRPLRKYAPPLFTAKVPA